MKFQADALRLSKKKLPPPVYAESKPYTGPPPLEKAKKTKRPAKVDTSILRKALLKQSVKKAGTKQPPIPFGGGLD